jgi:hypothetical protein
VKLRKTVPLIVFIFWSLFCLFEVSDAQSDKTIKQDVKQVQTVNVNITLDMHDKQLAINKDVNLKKLTSLNPDRQLGFNQIKELAREFGLFDKIQPNIHLRFKDGDIAFFEAQHLSEEEYRLEFYSRKLVLLAAQENNFVIDTQGDLAHAAQKVMADIIKKKIALQNK